MGTRIKYRRPKHNQREGLENALPQRIILDRNSLSPTAWNALLRALADFGEDYKDINESPLAMVQLETTPVRKREHARISNHVVLMSELRKLIGI